ncbi:MAG: ROK family protein [Chitinophagaceae bacterium]|nr:MAG: ROK family protein [Chitinophagaceae bacterium]
MKQYYLGIDLGGTRIKMGIVSDGRVIARRIVPARSAHGLAAALPQLEEEMNGLMATLPEGSKILAGVGLAFPGLVNTNSKKILSTNAKYDDAPSLDLEQWVTDKWSVPFAIDNDARMATVGEWKYGAGTDTNDLVVMTIGTGVGTSAVMEGKLLRGKHFQAGCLGGHFSIQVNGRPCSCGNEGCVEAHGSTWSLAEITREHPLFPQSVLSTADTIDFSVLFKAAAGKDALALEIVKYSMDVWSAGIVNLIHAYDPEVIVIGGGVLHSADVIMPYIREKVKKHAWTPWGTVDIRPTQLAEDAGILGVVHTLQYSI